MNSHFLFYSKCPPYPFRVIQVTRIDRERGFIPAVRIDTNWSTAQAEAYERLVLLNQPLPNGWKDL